ncbi:FRG domain-containing protein [Adhaeribacter soli]|uniref:FRG domain-containing protein n=1 Tax=Adhaeribacter soli TaxID=2607655 RepID=A0A5N1IS32_9BACT|nr:FRG domain-containing protein [Adhaeribacter soli]KAA9331146.1 FRG domain-containing protein [Adhaeribacter soli]
MSKREISDLDLKVKLTNEYLKNGGVEKIRSIGLLEDLLKVKAGSDGKVDPDTVSTRVNAFMLAILGDHLMPPFYDPEYISEYKSTLQKSNSFAQVNIDTQEHFDKIYEEYRAAEDILFRGQREAKWRLYSRLQRDWIIEKLHKNGSYQSLLERMVKLGKEEYGLKIQELLQANHIDSTNSIAVLAYLQHHGCPTPLLDWTYRFQNALYFALDGLQPGAGVVEIEDYCSVYYIEEKYFESSSLRNIISESLDSLEAAELQRLIDHFSKGNEKKREAMQRHFAGRKVFDRSRINGSGLISHMTQIEHLINFPLSYFSDKDKNTGVLFSLNNNKNIINQVGVFTWNAHPVKPLEMVADEQFNEEKTAEESNDYSFCYCFNINKKLSPYIRKRLETDGITKDFIYSTPDISTWDIFEKCKSN